MRWGSWLRILAIEVLVVVLSVATGLIENILTNQKHPSHALIYGLVSLAALTVGVLVAEPAFARSAVAIASSSDLSLVGLGLLGLVLGQRAGGERA